MQLVEIHIIKSAEIQSLCTKTKELYNQSLYYLRQSYFGKIEKFTEYQLSGIFANFKEPTFKSLPSKTAQQTIRLVFNDWKSYWASWKKWKNSGFKDKRPNLPSYKKMVYTAIFTKCQISIKNGYLHFPKAVNIKPIKTDIKEICQVRIVPLATTFKIEIVYEKETTDLKLNKNNIISIDLGIDNFCATVNSIGFKPFIINGKSIKSFNQWYNKKISKLKKKLPNSKFISKKIQTLTHFRNCWINDKLHKISRFITNFCIENDIGTLVIGKNLGWKSNVNLGKKTNQKFTQIPHTHFIEKLKYKNELVGIDTVITEESYTSKCDHLSHESMEHHNEYSGKRIKRGLFKSKCGKLINADGNGAMGIGRKVFGDDFVKNLINSRLAFSHYRINIL